MKPLGEGDDARARGGFSPGHRGDAAEQTDGRDALGHLVGAGERVRAAAGEPRGRELVMAEVIDDLGRVVSPLPDAAVAVIDGVAHAGPLHTHQPQAEALGGAPGLHRDLAARARRAVVPKHEPAGRVAELGVPQPSASPDADNAFVARRLDRRHAGHREPGQADHQSSSCRKEFMVSQAG